MNNTGDCLLALAVAFGFLWLIRVASLQVFPGPVRLLERLLRQLASAVWEVVWGMPTRRFGFIGVVWLVLIGFAVLTSVATLAAISEGSVIAAIGCLALSVVTWGMVVGTWHAARFVARRRYTPQPLPTRRRER